MISIVFFSVHALLTLNIPLPLLIKKLEGKGYTTVKVVPEFDGDQIPFGKPGNIIATKESIRIAYDPIRRVIRVIGNSNSEVINHFMEILALLNEISSDFNTNVLLYEMQSRVFFTSKIVTETVTSSDILGFNLSRMPFLYVMKNGNPNSTRWFSLEIRPIWQTYSKDNDKIIYEIKIIYRDDLDKVVSVSKNFGEILEKLLSRIIPTSEEDR